MKELSEVLKDWEAVIGLEIHTELTTSVMPVAPPFAEKGGELA